MATNHGHGAHAPAKTATKKLTKRDAHNDPHFPHAPKMKWTLDGNYNYVASSKFGRFCMLHSIWIIYATLGIFFAQDVYNTSVEFKDRMVNNWSKKVDTAYQNAIDFVMGAKDDAVSAVIPSAQADAYTPPVVTDLGGQAYVRLAEMSHDVYEDASWACNQVGYTPSQFRTCPTTTYTLCESEIGNTCPNSSVCNFNDSHGGSCGPMQINGIHRAEFDEQKYGMSFDACRMTRRCAMWFTWELLLSYGWGEGETSEEREAANVHAILRFKGVESYDTCELRLSSINKATAQNRTPEVAASIESGAVNTDQIDIPRHCARYS